MDALRNLISNCPDWVKRLDDLNGQIEQRQVELARFAETHPNSSARSVKSLRNKGSTESLKPKDEPAAHPTSPPPETASTPPPLLQLPETSVAHDGLPPASPTGASQTPSAIQRQAHQVAALAQSRARAVVRKRKTESMISAEGAMPKYRSRTMIIVYYDSYVQSFFEELVKFVSASRNMMRKAKMAAKVAQIKRMAELEMPDDEEEEEEANGTSGIAPALKPDGPLEASKKEGDAEELPALQYVSTRQMRNVSRSSTALYAGGRPMFARAGMASYGGRSGYGAGGMVDQPPDVYDELDKGLEYVQSMCEHAAHQFLRDGDCGEEVENIKRRLSETKDLADKEMKRVQSDPEAAKALEEPPKTRSFRPQSMRREMGSPTAKDVSNELEVDEGVDDMEQPELPKLVYKSTRAMGRPRGPAAV